MKLVLPVETERRAHAGLARKGGYGRVRARGIEQNAAESRVVEQRIVAATKAEPARVAAVEAAQKAARPGRPDLLKPRAARGRSPAEIVNASREGPSVR